MSIGSEPALRLNLLCGWDYPYGLARLYLSRCAYSYMFTFELFPLFLSFSMLNIILELLQLLSFSIVIHEILK